MVIVPRSSMSHSSNSPSWSSDSLSSPTSAPMMAAVTVLVIDQPSSGVSGPNPSP